MAEKILLFEELEKINIRPAPFEFYTASDLWTDEYTSGLTAFDQREETALYEVNLLNGFWSPNKYYGFLNTFKYEDEKVVLDKYTIIEKSRSRTIYNWLQYFSPEALEREFVECGFTIDTFYSDVAGLPFNPLSTEFAVVAKKI